MSIPSLTDEQRSRARSAATEARRRRAAAKQALRTGDWTLSELLSEADHDDALAHAKVVDVLKALPRVGAVRAAATMERLDIAPNRRLRGLGRHQVTGLLATFDATSRAT